MKKLLLLFIIFTSQISNACETLEQALEISLVNNSFLIVYFSEVSSANKLHEKDYKWLNKEDESLLNPFFHFTLYTDTNKKYLEKYNITSLPMMLLIDGNGKEIYRYSDYKNPSGFKDALANFVLPKYLLKNDLNNFHQKKSFNVATRIAQIYLDYSMIVEEKFKKNIYNVSNLYLEEAEKVLSNKDKSYNEKSQKLTLLKLYRLAYEKNFSLLEEKLNEFNDGSIFESNIDVFYFLKYISTKGLKKEDFKLIDEKTKQIEGFETFVKKANSILESEV